MADWHYRREREAYSERGKEPQDGGTRSVDRYLVRDEPAARRNGRRLLREAGIAVLESVDPATGRKLGDPLLHERVCLVLSIRNRSNAFA